MTVGDRGRLVIPMELRQRKNWPEGTVLIAVETERGVILTGRSELEQFIRAQLDGEDVVGALLEERRRVSAVEDTE